MQLNKIYNLWQIFEVFIYKIFEAGFDNKLNIE